MRIQYAEPVVIPAGAGAVQFEAFGRRFTSELSSNDRVTSKLPVQRKVELSRIQLLKGKLADNPRSWVRLAEQDGRIEGAVWDGQDLYVVTTLGGIAANLTTPIEAGPGQTVVFRLSDTLDAFPRGMCPELPVSSDVAPHNGLSQYRGLVADLAVRKDEALSIPLQVEISLIADASFRAALSGDPNFELLARHNVADGVYAEQVGLLIIPTDVRALTGTDPFTSTDASTLLGQLSTFRSGDSVSRARGITHLMTGRTLDGTTVGIARINGVCSATDGVSLTEISGNPTRDGLIMSHELGHNFGAVHDGTGVCASVPATFIMAPALNYSQTFSQCSLDSMRPVIQSASCITAANYGDVSLPAPVPEIAAEDDAPLVMPYVISSTGTQTAQAARFTLTAPTGFTITGATGPVGCTIVGGVATCELGNIPAGETRSVSVTLLPAGTGSFIIDARVSATNNPSTHNDDQQQPVRVTVNADAAISMTASATAVRTGDPVDFTLLVSSIRTHAVRNAVVTFSTFDNGFVSVDSAVAPVGNCTISNATVTCTLGDIPSGESRTITVHTTALAVGTPRLNANVQASADYSDANNIASVTLNISPARDVGLEEVTPNVVSLYGDSFEFKANLRSYGSLPIDGVALSITTQNPVAIFEGIDSVSVAGVTCTHDASNYYQCPVGTLAPGEVRAIVITGHGAGLGTYSFMLRASSPNDQNSANNDLTRGVTIKYGVDVQVGTSNTSGVETRETEAMLSLTSKGALAVASSVIDITAPASVHFVRTRFISGTGTCSIPDPQHLQCTLSFAANGGISDTTIGYVLIADVPGTFDLAVKATTPGDAVPSNDTGTAKAFIAPIVDVGIQAFTSPKFVTVAGQATAQANILVGPRPLTAVTVSVGTDPLGEVRSVSIGTGTCTRTGAAGFSCTLGDLAAGASVPITAVISAVSRAAPNTTLQFSVYSPDDNYPSNNVAQASVPIVVGGDMYLSFGILTVTGTAGAEFGFPRITIGRTGTFVDGRVEVTLPAGVTVSQVSAPAMCSGTSVLRCDLAEWPETQTVAIDLKLLAAAAGTYNIDVKLTAANDTIPNDNQATVVATVNTVATPTPSPPTGGGGAGGGGGGGRFEWLSVTLLGMLLAMQLRRARSGNQEKKVGAVNKIFAALLVFAMPFAAGAATQSPDSPRMQVRYAEKLGVVAQPGHVEFEAYGRHFALNLENNEHLLSGMTAARKAQLQLPKLQLLRGTVDGLPGSWVRLTSQGDYLAGAIWDGSDLYMVARYSEVAAHLVNPLAAAPSQTVVFRLSDTVNLLPPDFCGTDAGTPRLTANNGLVQYKAMVGELKLKFVAAPTDQIDISMVADSGLQQIYSNPDEDIHVAMLNTLNVVDGIYDAQLGLMVSASVLKLVPVGNDPFTSNDSSTLLGQLSNYRVNTPELKSRALTHLFTSRQLDANVLGIARLGGACSDADGVSLSATGFQGLNSMMPLIMAHEIGHNLNAPHDTAECGNTYLMWPTYSSQTQAKFSQCSLDAMRPFIVQNRGACITPAIWGDAEARIGVIPQQLRTEAFVWPVYLRNTGTGPLNDAELYITLQNPAVVINSITPSDGGTCTATNGNDYQHCTFGTLAPGAEVRVDLNLTSNQIDTLRLNLQANGSNDRYDDNDFAQASVDVVPNAMLVATIDPPTRSALVGEIVSYTLTLDSQGPRAATAVSASGNIGSGGIRFDGVTTSRGTCVLANLGGGYTCNVGDIPAGEKVAIQFQGHAIQGGTTTFGAYLSSGATMNTLNASAQLVATATRDVGIDLGAPYRVLAVGVATDLTFPVYAAGTLPIENVYVTFYPGSDSGATRSVDVDGTPCVKPVNVWKCTIGTMIPGETHVMRVSMKFDALPQNQANMNLQVYGDGDELGSNNYGNVLVTARAAVDVAVSDLSSTSVWEGQTTRMSATIRSAGVDAASNVRVTFDVPAPLQIKAGTLQNGTCTVATAQQLSCTLPSLAAGATANLTADVTSADPGTFTGKLKATADNDGIPENDNLDVALYWAPLMDLGVRHFANPPAFIIGRNYTMSFEIFSGKRDLPWADVQLPFGNDSVAIDSVTTTAGSCVASSSSYYTCHLGVFPANATATITMTVHGLRASGGSEALQTSTSLDSDHSNDLQFFNYSVVIPGDASVSVAAATVSGQAGQRLTLPTISLNTLVQTEGGSLEIPIPSFATVDSVTAPRGICTGSSPVKCYFSTGAVGDKVSVDITLLLNDAGTFTSEITGTAANDTNPANDKVTLSITSTARPQASGGGGGGSSSSGGGGGGGGGSFEWGSAALLGVLLMNRRRRAASTIA